MVGWLERGDQSNARNTLLSSQAMVASGSITVAGKLFPLLLLRMSFHCPAQSVFGRHHHGKPPDCQTSSMTPPFEEMARFLYQNVHRQPIRLFAKSYKLSMIASSLSIRLNQIKSRPLSSVASYHQVPSGTRTGVSCLIECSDPIHPNKKYTMQLLALCYRDYWMVSIRPCLPTV